MDKELISRINELAKKKREQGLSEQELQEQKKLYKIYLADIRGQFSATLDNVSIKEADGTEIPFKQAYAKKPESK
ncbi:MAG: DUF896 domain-containing protein [Ruminococcaceae bacterium]|nr:DUF896 domain-containing protein [Oscillospiraceae bacterium]